VIVAPKSPIPAEATPIARRERSEASGSAATIRPKIKIARPVRRSATQLAVNTKVRRVLMFASIRRWATSVRHCSRRLAHTRDPVERIAEAAGFTSISHLSREFRRHFGVSPRAYRSSA